MLTLVPYQLLLFPDARAHNEPPSPVGRPVREKRTAKQIIQAILAYLDWRAGNAWVNRADPSQNHHSERRNYLRARWLVWHAFYAEPALNRKPVVSALHLTDCVPFPLRTYSAEECRLAALSRSALEDQFLALRPGFPPYRLGFYNRGRLAAVILELRAAGVQPQRRRA